MIFSSKVLVLSFLAAAVVIALTVLNFTYLRGQNSVAQSVLTCMIGLIIPLMGWAGAKTNNRNLVGLFCTFSLTCAIFNLISYIVVMVALSVIRKYLGECLPDGTVIIDGVVNTTLCDDYSYSIIDRMYIVATCVSVPVILLQLVGSFYGSRLYSKLSPGVIITYQADPYPRGQVYGMTTVNPVVVTAPQPAPPSASQRPTIYPAV